ncbi:MAG: UbiA family prenyltransferase [Burkholderiales bacterium]|nr:UbiA family prenyltransferase [Burkholderiales bacterium]
MTSAPPPNTQRDLPVCVDLDGTLIYTDLLFESFLLLLRQNFFAALKVPFWLLRHGKAATKLRIAEMVAIQVEHLPYCEPVLAYVRAQRELGRRTVLATASARRYAQAIADHLGVFDEVLATTTAELNLSATRKAGTLTQRFPDGFEYIGNSRDDLAVWQAARVVSIANATAGVRAAAQQIGRTGFQTESPFRAWRAAFKGVRLHQWLKNLLIFLPVLAGHQLTDTQALKHAVLAFFAFGLCASSVYLFNDLLDIEADRRHPRKRLRPFAAGALSVPMGGLLTVVLLASAAAVCFMLPAAFGAVLLMYYLLTLSYSIRLKAQVMVDVMMLSALYTVRLLAGSAATGIVLSFWLLAFSMFLFLSLALLKRYGEMRMLARTDQRRSAGRGYSTDDLVVLLALGAASGYSAVLVLALYVNSADVTRLYVHPQVLWGAIPILVYWLSRIWLKSHRGEVHDDPVVFAARDWQSLVLIAVMLGLGLVASYPGQLL